MKLIINSKHLNDLPVKHCIDLIGWLRFFCIFPYTSFMLYCHLLFMFLWFNFWGISNDRHTASILIYWTLSFCSFSKFVSPLMSQLDSLLKRYFAPCCHVLQTIYPLFLNCLTIGDLILTNLVAFYFINILGFFYRSRISTNLLPICHKRKR